MREAANSRDRMRAALVIVAVIATIGFNALAAAGLVNGVTPAQISEKYPTVLTPAGYAFSIWSLIYLGITAFAVYQLLPANLLRFRRARSVFILTCLLNCAWIYFWHRDQIAICLVLIIALLASLIMMLVLFGRSESAVESLFTNAPFGIYAGWVTAASLVNFLIFLKYERVELSVFAWNTLGAVLIILAAVLAVIVRLKLRNYFYPLAIAWALTAIAIKQTTNTAIVVAAAIGVVTCLITAGTFVVNLKDSTSE
ncbi:MAG: TspO/MBR family protein [Pyrinomonadaceae bacterium]